MKRILLADVQTDQNGVRQPNVAEGLPWVVLAERGDYMLIKIQISNEAARTAATIADLDQDSNGRQTDVETAGLTAGQRDAIRTRLQNAGFDRLDELDGSINDRRKLLWLIVRRMFRRSDMTLAELLHGYDAE